MNHKNGRRLAILELLSEPTKLHLLNIYSLCLLSFYPASFCHSIPRLKYGIPANIRVHNFSHVSLVSGGEAETQDEPRGAESVSGIVIPDPVSLISNEAGA